MKYKDKVLMEDAELSKKIIKIGIRKIATLLQIDAANLSRAVNYKYIPSKKYYLSLLEAVKKLEQSEDAG